MKTPLVSIVCITYNHESYIRECIDGFLMQKTDFSIEVLIHDDASTDKTADIIRQYERQYPNIIKPIYQTENQYSKGINPGVEYLFPAAQGKYIALCEGDDYWTDPYKLQKQVDFLEDNEEYGMVHTDYDYKDEQVNQIITNKWYRNGEKHDEEVNCAPLLLSDQYKVATGTVLARANLIKKTMEIYPDDFGAKYKMGDIQLWFHLSRLGKIKYFNDSTTVYRRHQNGVTAVFDVKKRFEFLENAYFQKKYFAERYGYDEVIQIVDKNYLFSLGILSNKLKYKKDFKKYFTEYKSLPNTTLKDIMKFRLLVFFDNHTSLYRFVKQIKKYKKNTRK